MRFKTNVLTIVAAMAIGSALGLTSCARQKSPPQTAAEASNSHTAPAMPAGLDGATQGFVVKMTGRSIIIRNKGEDMIFAINPDTQKLGDIAAGREVIVHYRDENKLRVATVIRNRGA